MYSELHQNNSNINIQVVLTYTYAPLQTYTIEEIKNACKYTNWDVIPLCCCTFSYTFWYTHVLSMMEKQHRLNIRGPWTLMCCMMVAVGIWHLKTLPICSIIPILRHAPKQASSDLYQYIQGQKVFYNVLPTTCTSEFQISGVFLFYDSPLLSYRPFWYKCTEWLQNNHNSTKSKVPHICVTVRSRRPQVHSIPLYVQPFSQL